MPHGLKMKLARILISRLPNRLKRAVMLSSFFAYMVNLKDEDFKGRNLEELQPIVNKFNSLFKMLEKKEGLYFPMYAKKLIWSDLIQNETFEYKDHTVSIRDAVDYYGNRKFPDLIAIMEKVIESTPSWLMYTDDMYLLKKDLSKVVEFVYMIRSESKSDQNDIFNVPSPV